MGATCDSSHGVAKAATTKCNTCAKNGDECCTTHRCDNQCTEVAKNHGWPYVCDFQEKNGNLHGKQCGGCGCCGADKGKPEKGCVGASI